MTSPTFGGSSWFAHSSFLSGIEVANPDRYALLLTQHRPTLVSTFKQAGYRAVGLMPGLKKEWPEGAFYGFDTIYGADALDYRGPEFGWWRIRTSFRWQRWTLAKSRRVHDNRCCVLPHHLDAHAVSPDAAGAEGLASRAVETRRSTRIRRRSLTYRDAPVD